MLYAPNGDILVADGSDGKIRVFGQDNSDKGTIGSALSAPAALTIKAGKLYVLELNGKRVSVFE